MTSFVSYLSQRALKRRTGANLQNIEITVLSVCWECERMSLGEAQVLTGMLYKLLSIVSWQLIIYMSKFETICKLGEGSFGQVYKVRRVSDSREYALKKVKMGSLKEKDRKNTLNEVRILASLDHPNIIHYRQALFDQSNAQLALIMELAQRGDLAQTIKTRFKSAATFAEPEIWNWGIQILQGLHYLHQMGVIHRDIKPANILFTLQDVVQIGDLNVARELREGLAHSQTGTPNYASPEIWENKGYGPQCDIWSFGCVLYELCTFRVPFRSRDFDELYEKVQSLKYDPIPSRYSLTLQNVINKCLQKKQKRIKLEELLRIFRRKSSQKQQKRCSSAGNLLKQIEMPANLKQISTILPKPRYSHNRKHQSIANPEQQSPSKGAHPIDAAQMSKEPVLTKVSKPQSLNHRPYSGQVENAFNLCKSQKLVKERERMKKEDSLKLISFKQILESLAEAKLPQKAGKQGLRKRNIRGGLKLH